MSGVAMKNEERAVAGSQAPAEALQKKRSNEAAAAAAPAPARAINKQSAALSVARSLAAAPAPGAALALLASFIRDLSPASSADVR